MNMTVVDTNVLVNFLSLDFPKFFDLTEEERKRVEVFSSRSLKSFVIPEFILAEFNLVSLKSINKKIDILSEQEMVKKKNIAIAFLLEKFLANAFIYIPEREEIDNAMKMYVSIQTKDPIQTSLTFTDLLLFVIAKTHDFELLTSDKRLEVLARSSGVRLAV